MSRRIKITHKCRKCGNNTFFKDLCAICKQPEIYHSNRCEEGRHLFAHGSIYDKMDCCIFCGLCRPKGAQLKQAQMREKQEREQRISRLAEFKFEEQWKNQLTFFKEENIEDIDYEKVKKVYKKRNMLKYRTWAAAAIKFMEKR